MVKIGLIQMAAEPLNLQANLSKAGRHISKTAQDGAEIVVLPEMFNVGFSCNEKLMNLGENLDGYTVTWLKDQAEKHQVYIITSIYEKIDGYFFNTMVMVGFDKSVQIYRKRNPTCQERLVWKRCKQPGPGIFETPFGRVGGAICFDSFSRETFEGFRQSGVEIVIIVALWGTVVPMLKHPDSMCFSRILRRQSYLASEVVPHRYATALEVPAVYVNQCGRVKLPIAHPRFYPLPDWPNSIYEFVGNSNVHDKSGKKWIRDVDLKKEFSCVAAVEMNQKKKRSQISRVNIFPDYMDRGYYFVQPPFMFKLYQQLCFTGFEKQYEKRCCKYSSAITRGNSLKC
ncbi:carbon-nitrogen hydrolase family protein [Desulfospira joergensenii]|uniref:carbon-nitrogen hydrolase family protein n=1 Tax=Desulfospira joergensenii TaxID=53329 RepID=UPI0003B367C7|nr:carbon-nitrogen hydrolase family protein [Desulfospira joergensenii]